MSLTKSRHKYKFYKEIKVDGIGPKDSSVLIVGESPGNDECIHKEPFVGRSGEILNNCLARHGLPRESVRIENLFPYRPWNDYFEHLLELPFLDDYILKIHLHILKYKPKVIFALGNYPMYHLTGKGKRTKAGKVTGIGNWRGSILPYRDITGKYHEDIKVIPALHPAAVAREKSLYPIFDTDIKRVKEEINIKGLNYKDREIIINPTGLSLLQECKRLQENPVHAIDIETIKGTTTILSISFSISDTHALVLSPDTPEFMLAVDKLLKLPSLKVFHFGYFDTTQLQLNGYEIGIDQGTLKLNRPYFWDTYIAAHVIEPELPKTLAFEASVRTREPYWKQEGKEEGDQKGWSKKADKNRLYRYNGKDTAVDFEIFLSQYQDMDSKLLPIFNFEMESMIVHMHMSNSGMLIDPARLQLLKEALITRWAKLQYLLDGIAGFEVNVRSPKLKDWLYTKENDGGLGLPSRSKNKRITTDDDALVSLLAWCKDKINTSVKEETKTKYKRKMNLIRSVREIRNIRQRMSMYIDSKVHEDGRSRSLYKWGPETGRLAASMYVDGFGYNHQTNPRDPIEVSEADFEKYKNETKLLETLEPVEVEEEEDEN